MSRMLSALLGATICLTLAADTTGRITGKVLDKAGKPVPNATIVLKRTDISWTKTLKVSGNGTFQQVGLEPKEFDITASAEGFAPLTIHLKIPLGDTLNQDFCLMKPEDVRAAAPQGAPQPSGDKAVIGADAFNQAVVLYNDKNYTAALPLVESAFSNLKESLELLPAEKKPELESQVAQVERVYGVVLFEVGRQDAARQTELWGQAEPRLKAALARNPKDQRVLDALITTSKAKGDTEAATTYQASLDALIGPRPELAFNQGVETYNKGDMAAAKPFFLKAIQVDPNFAEAYYMLAMCEFAGNNLKATKQNFKKYLEVAPKGKHAEEVKAMLEDPSLKGIK
ncbi:MAG: hypothetical protein H6Q00_1534 [Holophagaceae bacterium]|nr:hypothetical protein [Holophagaceae bacterium]